MKPEQAKKFFPLLQVCRKLLDDIRFKEAVSKAILGQSFFIFSPIVGERTADKSQLLYFSLAQWKLSGLDFFTRFFKRIFVEVVLLFCWMLNPISQSQASMFTFSRDRNRKLKVFVLFNAGKNGFNDIANSYKDFLK